MICTAVDSSVLLDVFSADPVHGERSLAALQKCWREGSLVACDVVWAEIRPRFDTDDRLIGTAEEIGLQFEPLNLQSAVYAGVIWKKYHARGGKKDRMVPDFLIGAHGGIQADRLLTRDRGFYRDYFPRLKILEP